MNINEFKLLNYFYNKSIKRENILIDKQTIQVLNNHRLIKKLIKASLIKNDQSGITELGLKKLNPYKVDNAVILAAGIATRLVPLSLEYPKGLFEVRGQKLIEREIEQLKEAGINNIMVVLGYKKEMFYYLKDKYDVKFIINEEYNTKNNIESLYRAKDYLKNTYVCPCDVYFISNPFNQYEYNSFYAGYESNEQTDEMYAITDNDNRIIDIKNSLKSGNILLGHTFWNKNFSKKFIDLAKCDQKIN